MNTYRYQDARRRPRAVALSRTAPHGALLHIAVLASAFTTLIIGLILRGLA